MADVVVALVVLPSLFQAINLQLLLPSHLYFAIVHFDPLPVRKVSLGGGAF